MVRSILDTDLYKFSTSYAYMKLYPEAEGVFDFCDRNNTVFENEIGIFDTVAQNSIIGKLTVNFVALSKLRLTALEEEWCTNNIPYIPKVYWEWLSQFQFDFDKIWIWLDGENHLHIKVKDLLYKVTLYEVPILAIVSELYSELNGKINYSDAMDKLDVKIKLANDNNLPFSEFGTRRRACFTLQDRVLERIKATSKTCVGTSNVYFAMKYDMKPIGTFPHEWIMFHGAIWGYQEANYLGMRDWIRTYDGNLGIFLMDTYTSKVGLRNMSLKYAKLFDGVRQDSGDEYEIINLVIQRYKELGIDYSSKTIVFSNALDFQKALKIKTYCDNRGIKSSFGIGTNLTNDTEYKPANIVMKLVTCRINKHQDWRNCIKISDDLRKHLGNDKEFEIAKYQLKLC